MNSIIMQRAQLNYLLYFVLGAFVLVFSYFIISKAAKEGIEKVMMALGFSKPSEIEKIIACEYYLCDQGINNDFCNDNGITPYDPKADLAYRVLEIADSDISSRCKYFHFIDPGLRKTIDNGKYRCDWFAVENQFPKIVKVKSGDVIRGNALKSLSGGVLRCVNSFAPPDSSGFGAVLFVPPESSVFSIYQTESDFCIRECSPSSFSHRTTASKVEIKEDTTLYLWPTHKWPEICSDPVASGPYRCNQPIVVVSAVPKFINLTKPGEQAGFYGCSPTTMVKRVHIDYKDRDFVVIFCAKDVSCGECITPDDADNRKAYDVYICDVDNEKCEPVGDTDSNNPPHYFLYNGKWYYVTFPNGENDEITIGIKYNGSYFEVHKPDYTYYCLGFNVTSF